jgi:hypothetical protein
MAAVKPWPHSAGAFRATLWFMKPALCTFLLRGLLGCLIGTLIGYFNIAFLFPMISDRFGHPFYWKALFGLCGIIAGAVQGGFLRRATRPAPLWLALSGTGWLFVGYVDVLLASPATRRIDVLLVSSATTTTGHMIIVGLLLGGLAALPPVAHAAAFCPLCRMLAGALSNRLGHLGCYPSSALPRNCCD